ncbi:MAG: VWA containing CoxE family protein [Microcystis aeruginosa W13-11]|nr:VWA containing CoxE family protein [Microcystis aeruginosa W13-11]
MSNFDPKQMLDEVFKLVRQDFQIGVSEYLAALKALAGGWGEEEEELRETLQLLWCHCFSQQEQFYGIWDTVKISLKTIEPNDKLEKESKSLEKTDSDTQIEVTKTTIPSETNSLEWQTTYRLGTAPTRAPFITTETETPNAFPTDFPLSRRAMVYHWQYVNRPVKDGSEDILDVDQTVEKAAHQGFFLSPFYTRRETNHVHLLLLIDQNGSMTPFHYLTRELVETANCESTLEKENLNVYYFHNVPATSIYQDPYLTKSILLAQVLEMCKSNTSVLIVSDGGAARGFRRFERFEATNRVLADIKRKTNYIAWLNPMPQNRWERTSAQLIAYRVPMYPMNKQGLSNAIDTIMGKTLSHYR